MDVYTLDDSICSLLSLYPGMKSEIIEYGRAAENQSNLLKLDGNEKALYIDDYIRDCLD